MLKYGPRFAPLLQLGWLHRAVDRFAEQRFHGPDENARRTKRTQIWGKITQADGDELEGFLETPEPYRFSVSSALCAVRRVLAGSVSAGAWTPSQAFGSDFLSEVGGSALELQLGPPYARSYRVAVM